MVGVDGHPVVFPMACVYDFRWDEKYDDRYDRAGSWYRRCSEWRNKQSAKEVGKTRRAKDAVSITITKCNIGV